MKNGHAIWVMEGEWSVLYLYSFKANLSLYDSISHGQKTLLGAKVCSA